MKENLKGPLQDIDPPHSYGLVREGIIIGVVAIDPNPSVNGGFTIDEYVATPYAQSIGVEFGVRIDTVKTDAGRPFVGWAYDGTPEMPGAFYAPSAPAEKSFDARTEDSRRAWLDTQLEATSESLEAVQDTKDESR